MARRTGLEIRNSLRNNGAGVSGVLAAVREIQAAFQSAFSRMPMDHRAGALQAEAAPSVPQERTFHQQRWWEPSGLPLYSTWMLSEEETFPLSHKSPTPARRERSLEATRTW